MKWVKETTWETNSPSNSSFIAPKNNFLNHSHRGLSYVKNNLVPVFNTKDYVANEEVVYENHKALKDFKDKSVLIIGSGPSLYDFDFSLTKKYDKIITCNFYFNIDKVKNLPISMIFLGDEVNLNDEKLKEELEQKEYLICFENIGRPVKQIIDFKKNFMDRTTWAHTRYHSKIGAVVRQAAFICDLEPKKISFIGMDGVKANRNEKNFFRPEKKPSGTFETNFKGIDIENKYKEQYLEFWDYILHDAGSKISFENLGHGHPCNLSTEILLDKLGKNYFDYLNNPEERNK